MKLTADKVHEIFMKCLFEEEESKENYVEGEGVMIKVGFHPNRLKEAESDIIHLLEELPDEFKQSGGGGWSFLNMCNDKHGNQWADLHTTMDELVCLGNAVGKLQFQLPREIWQALPGGMPYLVVLEEVKA